MIIANIRSPSDLEDKRRLQNQLIELEIANESEMERRVKDFKNPYKAVEVPPQQRTTAELRKDKLEQERQAIKNLGELNFEYSKSAELVAWLSSSEIDKLVDFNANFKGIKKDLLETTNPKLLSTEYLKNYLERYFEDLDVSYGRKFAQQTSRNEEVNLNIDEVIESIPSEETLNEVKNMMMSKQQELTRVVENTKGNRDVLLGELGGESGVEPIVRMRRRQDEPVKPTGKKQILKNIEIANKDIEKMTKLINKGYLILNLIELYKTITPNEEFINTMKTALSIQERTDLVRRYGKQFKKIKALNEDELSDLLYQLSENSPSNDETTTSLIYGRLERGLSFLANDKNIDLIMSLNRNYENFLAKEGKEIELDKIRKYNEIQEKRRQEALENMKNFFKDVRNTDEIIENYEDEGYDASSLSSNISEGLLEKSPFVLNAMSKFTSGDYAREIEAQEDPEEKMRYDEIQAERALALAQQIEYQAKQQETRENEARTKIANLLRRKVPIIQQKVAEKELERIRAERFRILPQMEQYYNDFLDELRAIQGGNNRYYTYRALLERLGIMRETLQQNGVDLSLPRARLADELFRIINNFVIKRIEDYRSETLDYDYDYDGSQGRNLIIPQIKTSNNEVVDLGNGNIRTTQRGLGLKKALKKHFKEDEEELMDMAKSLKKHKQKEEEIDRIADLGFKHKRIKVGKGITLKENKKPNYKTFGKYVIHVGHLVDKNVANFKYPSLASIPSIKPIPITDDYKDFILDMLENERPNERLLKRLSTEEQKHFERVLKGAGLLNEFKIKKIGDEEEKNEIERFNILRGEVLAGNNNDNVLKELKLLIVKFVNDGRIGRQEGLNMLMELSLI